MYRMGFLALAIALLAQVPSASAQKQRPQQGQRGGFGGGFGGFGGDPLSLLGQESVKAELKLTDEQTKKVADLTAKRREGFSGLRDLSPEDRRKKMLERATETDKGLAEVLTAEQHKRLKQIAWQQQGSRAIASPDLATALKLTDEQMEKVKTIFEESAKSLREAFQANNREGLREKMEAARKATDEKLTAVLTDDQKSKMKELLGEAFKGEIKRPEFGTRPRRPQNNN